MVQNGNLIKFRLSAVLNEDDRPYIAGPVRLLSCVFAVLFLILQPFLLYISVSRPIS